VNSSLSPIAIVALTVAASLGVVLIVALLRLRTRSSAPSA